MAAKASNAPATVAEGLGIVLDAISKTMQAPDATQFAGPLLKLQSSVLDMVHGQLKGGGQAPGAPAGGGAPGGQSPLMGGIAGMQGGGGPPPPPTTSPGAPGAGMDPEALRQMAAMGADQGGGDEG